VWNGGVYASGFGPIGDGTTISSGTPIAVCSLSSGVTVIARGDGTSLAVQNGGVNRWGLNGVRQLVLHHDNQPCDAGCGDRLVQRRRLHRR
jgi:hypothetical protein